MQDKIARAEVNRKLKVLLNHCTQLQGQFYPSKGPRILLILLQKIIKQILSRFNLYNSIQITLIGSLCNAIERFIGYIDTSEMSEVPWSIIPALGKLFGIIRPNCEFIICPVWETNYAIYNSNLIQDLRATIIEAPKLLFEQDDKFQENINNFMKDQPQGLYFLFYPRIERLSVLHFSLLGHEIGHLSADEWLQNNWGQFLDKFKIIPNLSEYFDKKVKSRNRPPQLFDQQYIRISTSRSIEIFKKTMKELLSDIFGVLVFGPSSLFSSYIFALNSQFDDVTNVSNGYLPWRYRLRILKRVLLNLNIEGLKDKFGKWLDLVFTTCDDQSDLNALKTTPDLDYILILLDAIDKSFDDLCGDLKKIVIDNSFDKISNNEDHNEVLIRLKDGITPNAIMFDNLKERPIDIRAIVSGTWSYLTQIPLDDIEEYSKESRLANLLSLKAIELSTIQENFNNDADKRRNN